MKDNQANKKSNGRKRKRSHTFRKIIVTAICIFVMGWGVWHFTVMASRYDGEEAAWVRIPHGATEQQVADSLKAAVGDRFARKVMGYWSGDPAKARGAYLIAPDDKAISVARRLENGRQTPVKLTFNNIRTLPQLESRFNARMDWADGEFMEAFRNEARHLNVTPEVLLGRMAPDTYEVYWTSTPDKVIEKILSNYNSFWTPERKAKAESIGLTPDQVAIIASIAEEESNKPDERGMIARLYMNRLDRGMRLQADPTVKYAVGDFAIKRVGGAMLNVDSPYNTYRYAGLPPSPIRIPDLRTFDAVLNAPAHDYIYMCAKADFSGYHDFTSDYATHLRKAAEYRRALDANGYSLYPPASDNN